MANAFYRSSSSGGKKNNDRERRQAAFSASEENSEAAASSVAAGSESPSRKNGSGRAESRSEGRSLFTWRANITPSALVTISVLALVLLGFSFLSGVIVGRSSMPLPQALELERLLADETPAGEGEAEEKEKILPKEELRFMTSLKSDPSGGVLSDAQPQAASAAPAVTQEKPKEEKPKQEVQKPKEPQFDYVLRVAAFKEQAQAKAQKELTTMIKQYEELLHKNWKLATKEQKARIAQMRARIAQMRAQTQKITGEGMEVEDMSEIETEIYGEADQKKEDA